MKAGVLRFSVWPDWLRVAVYRYVLLPQANFSGKLLACGCAGKTLGGLLKLWARFSSGVEVKAHAGLWVDFLRKGSVVELMKLCHQKHPTVAEVKAHALDGGWTESRVDSFDEYAAFPAQAHVVLSRDGDGYFVFGDGAAQVVDAKGKARHTYHAPDDGKGEGHGGTYRTDGADGAMRMGREAIV